MNRSLKVLTGGRFSFSQVYLIGTHMKTYPESLGLFDGSAIADVRRSFDVLAAVLGAKMSRRLVGIIAQKRDLGIRVIRLGSHVAIDRPGLPLAEVAFDIPEGVDVDLALEWIEALDESTHDGMILAANVLNSAADKLS